MAKQKSLAEKVFGTRDFFRTLSFREFATAIALALLLIAIIFVIKYLGSSYWFEDHGELAVLLVGPIVVLMNHVLYRMEHRRSNNYIGRNIIDYMFCLSGYLFTEFISIIFNGQLIWGVPTVGGLIVGAILFIVWIMIFELLVAGLKRILIKFGWPII